MLLASLWKREPFLGKLLEEQDGDLPTEDIRMLSQAPGRLREM
jgi:hypothetical protein